MADQPKTLALSSWSLYEISQHFCVDSM